MYCSCTFDGWHLANDGWLLLFCILRRLWMFVAGKAIFFHIVFIRSTFILKSQLPGLWELFLHMFLLSFSFKEIPRNLFPNSFPLMFVMNNNEYMHPDPDENLQPRTLIYWFSPNNPLKHKTSISGLINSIQLRIHSEY